MAASSLLPLRVHSVLLALPLPRRVTPRQTRDKHTIRASCSGAKHTCSAALVGARLPIANRGSMPCSQSCASHTYRDSDHTSGTLRTKVMASTHRHTSPVHESVPMSIARRRGRLYRSACLASALWVLSELSPLPRQPRGAARTRQPAAEVDPPVDTLGSSSTPLASPCAPHAHVYDSTAWWCRSDRVRHQEGLSSGGTLESKLTAARRMRTASRTC